MKAIFEDFSITKNLKIQVDAAYLDAAEFKILVTAFRLKDMKTGECTKQLEADQLLQFLKTQLDPELVESISKALPTFVKCAEATAEKAYYKAILKSKINKLGLEQQVDLSQL